jgi:hypothetical protein
MNAHAFCKPTALGDNSHYMHGYEPLIDALVQPGAYHRFVIHFNDSTSVAPLLLLDCLPVMPMGKINAEDGITAREDRQPMPPGTSPRLRRSSPTDGPPLERSMQCNAHAMFKRGADSAVETTGAPVVSATDRFSESVISESSGKYGDAVGHTSLAADSAAERKRDIEASTAAGIHNRNEHLPSHDEGPAGAEAEPSDTAATPRHSGHSASHEPLPNDEDAPCRQGPKHVEACADTVVHFGINEGHKEQQVSKEAARKDLLQEKSAFDDPTMRTKEGSPPLPRNSQQSNISPTLPEHQLRQGGDGATPLGFSARSMRGNPDIHGGNSDIHDGVSDLSQGQARRICDAEDPISPERLQRRLAHRSSDTEDPCVSVKQQGGHATGISACEPSSPEHSSPKRKGRRSVAETVRRMDRQEESGLEKRSSIDSPKVEWERQESLGEQKGESGSGERQSGGLTRDKGHSEGSVPRRRQRREGEKGDSQQRKWLPGSPGMSPRRSEGRKEDSADRRERQSPLRKRVRGRSSTSSPRRQDRDLPRIVDRTRSRESDRKRWRGERGAPEMDRGRLVKSSRKRRGSRDVESPCRRPRDRGGGSRRAESSAAVSIGHERGDVRDRVQEHGGRLEWQARGSSRSRSRSRSRSHSRSRDREARRDVKRKQREKEEAERERKAAEAAEREARRAEEARLVMDELARAYVVR